MTQPRVWLRRLEAQDFRNLERLTLELSAEGAAIIGHNGHGKTNLLEAISYLQTLRSVRGARDTDLTRFGESGFHLSAEADTPGAHRLELGFELGTKRKKILVDGMAPKRLSDALGALPSVIFSPRDVELVGGGAAERRRYLDMMLALTSLRYLGALQKYRAALSQRNAGLRAAARGLAKPGDLGVWEEQLAESGAVILEERKNWVAASRGAFSELSSRIGETGASTMQYQSSVELQDDGHEALLRALGSGRASDVKRGITSVGPHRDDLSLLLDGRPLRVFGSAGQQRTAAIALRMIESATLRTRVGAEPILLLDDPFAELDHSRAERILELIRESGRGQILLTIPRAGDIPHDLMRLPRFEMSRGVVRPLERAA